MDSCVKDKLFFRKKQQLRKIIFSKSLSIFTFPFTAYQDRGFDDLDCRNSTIAFANMEEKPYICKYKNKIANIYIE